MAAYLDTYGCGSTQPQVEQYEVGLVVADDTPVFCLVVGCADYLRLGNVVADDAFCAFEFEGHVLYYYYLEIIHIYIYYL